MSRKIGCSEKDLAGFSLFEILISLGLFALTLTLLFLIQTQATKMWHESEEEEVLMNESRTLLHLLDRDLKNASSMPLTFRNQSDLFFLTRNGNDDLVAVAYFFDPQKKGHYYRFVATAKETLEANHDGTLKKLYDHATARDHHCKLMTTHLLACEFIPISINKKEISLLEINLSLGKITPRYFSSTVISVQR